MHQENLMGTMPIPKLIVKMSLPPVFSMFLQYSYNLIDSAFVAQLSENALTAVSLSFPITALMTSASVWLGVGINILIAGYLGENEPKKANRAVTHGLLLSVLVGTALNVLALVLMRPYFAAFTRDASLYALCLEYLGVCAFMQVPSMVYISIEKILQATGNMIQPMFLQIAGVLVNLVFDPLLIFGIGPFPQMGVTGAALASVMGYIFSMLLALWLLFGTKQQVRMETHGFRAERKMIRGIFMLGLPSFVMNALSSFSVIFVNLFLAGYTPTAIAFFGVYFKVQQMIAMTMNGLIQGVLPIMRFNHSAAKPRRVQAAFHVGTGIVMAIMGVGALLLLAAPRQILALFAASAEMQALGVPAMRILGIGFLFNGFSTMSATYLQATDHILPSIFIQLCRQFAVLLPLMAALNAILQMRGIWIAFPAAEIFTAVLAAGLYVRCKAHPAG